MHDNEEPKEPAGWSTFYPKPSTANGECKGVNCPQYTSRCIAYGEPSEDCPLKLSNRELKAIINLIWDIRKEAQND